MAASFRMDLPAGSEESASRQLATVRACVEEELVRAFAQLKSAQKAGDADLARRLELEVLPSLVTRARVAGVTQFPRGMTAAIVVGKVRWSGEEALLHLESLGFRRPGSSQQLPKRVREFVRKLVLKGKGSQLPEELFEVPLSLVAGRPDSPC